MESCIINPERKRGEPQLPVNGILAVNPSDTRFLSTYAEQTGMRRHFLFHSTLFASNNLFLAGPAVGAPMAALVLEKLIALGAENILLYGWCGSLQKGLHAMDVFVPDRAVSEEGTSHHYAGDTGPVYEPSMSLRARVCQFLLEQHISFQHGPVWSTDAPYRETDTKVAQYNEQGIFAVDMEYSAVCALAAFRQVNVAAVMLVSDELLNRPWTPSYSLKIFKQKSSTLLDILCNFAGEPLPNTA